MRLASLFVSILAWGGCAQWMAPLLADDAIVDAVEMRGQAERTFIEKYCSDCHSGSDPSANLDLIALPSRFSDVHVEQRWREVFTSVGNHSMPPADSPQPDVKELHGFMEWLEKGIAQAELSKRSTQSVLRRMNRQEYNNTIRDLTGIDMRPADAFPQDASAGGFDNIGSALSLSPMQIELYYDAARKVIDRALVEGARPRSIRWRFDPEENDRGADRLRVRRGNNNVLLNRNNNPVEGPFTVIRHEQWDKDVGFRDFSVPVEGEYTIRFRGAGRVPDLAKTQQEIERILARNRDERLEKEPNQRKWIEEEHAKKLEHFRTSTHYRYGPPRMKVVQHLGGTPRTIAEMDVPASELSPEVYEVQTYFTTDNAGIALHYHYDIPSNLENWTIQKKDEFPRPELLIDWIEIEGPRYQEWPPESHRRILFESPNEKDEAVYAREVLNRFMRRAYRRPVTKAEVNARVEMFSAARESGQSFLNAIKLPLIATLTSPHFLFLVEPSPVPKNSQSTLGRELNAHELAARLSYFVWSSMPDDELMRLASQGKLSDPRVLSTQLDRMLEDPRSDAFVSNFVGQWLNLRSVGANPPATTLYPEYDRHLELSIVRESESFFAEILRNDLDLRNLVRSDFVTINERLARFYEIPDIKGDHMRRVEVPLGVMRGGVPTQASVLSVTSNGTRTSPVVRGVWVLKTLLGIDPGLPVANVGEIQPTVPGIDKATVRQRLAIHRELASCARCHDRIDPLGFGLENYDASGKWREREGHGYNGRIEPNDPIIDASAVMPDGSEFVGVQGLQSEILKDDTRFLNSFARQMTTYAFGRELGVSDLASVREHVDYVRTHHYTIRSLMHAIVTSESFKTK